MILHVKNMICKRCKIVVSKIIADLGLQAEYIKLGEILLKEKLKQDKLNTLNTALKETGLELVNDREGNLVQKIKTVIFEMIHFCEEPLLIKFSCYLSSRLNYSYTYLANTFKKINGISIEQFIIIEKIKKVKGMLIAEGITLSEIAYRMNYSSTSHLSAQFKKVTGLRVTDFKLMHTNTYMNRLTVE